MRITMENGHLNVPDFPEIAYIEGDGVGKEISDSMRRVIDSAVSIAFSGRKGIEWKEALAGGKATERCGTNLPDETLSMIKDSVVAIKGPLTTPVGKGARSINVALRQNLDLYVCLRPVKHYNGVPSPVIHPENVDIVVFRENTEDIYAGIEWPAGSDDAEKMIRFLRDEMKVSRIRFPESSAIGIKPVSEEGSKRIIRAAILYALDNNRRNVTLVHKGNIMKFTEGGFRNWGYELARDEFSAYEKDGRIFIPRPGDDLEIKDCICDAFLQNILLKPEAYDVIATMNLNGDYISDALAAEVGGIGIAPGANINYSTGTAVFEATHGTAPDIAGKNTANPLSIILSGVMMLEYIGWNKAADMIKEAIPAVISEGMVTRDLYDLMVKEGKKGTALSTSEFTDYLISRL